MPRYVAIEWDSREARVVVARVAAGAVVAEHAFDVELAPRDPGQTFADVDVSARIRGALDSRGIGRCDALAAVGRASIELRMLSLPPAPEEELPQMVRFQAQRQFSQFADDWPLDFLPTGEPRADSQRVLAAALSPHMMRQIVDTCQAAELKVVRLALRAAASGWLLSQQPSAAVGRVTLFIDPLAEEADLTILDGQQIAVMRTVKLPGDVSEAASVEGLLGEAKRTMAAAQNQLDGRQVERIVLCGGTDDAEPLATRLRETLGAELELFDPFSTCTLGGEAKHRRPRHLGRYASLLGMLQAESKLDHPIDFLNPRQPPRAHDHRRQVTWSAAAAALLALLFGGWLYSALGTLDDELLQLQKQRAANVSLVKKAEQRRADLGLIEQWAASDVDLLSELQRMSAEFPAAEESIVTKLQFTGKDSGGGLILFEGGVAGPDTLTQLEAVLRDEAHPRVAAQGGQLDAALAPYDLPFKASLTVVAPDLEARLEQRTAADASATEESP